MNNLNYAKFEIIDLQKDPFFNEKWVQDRIEEDPKILGLGDVTVHTRERRQPRAGRLDFLMQSDDESDRRYAVEIQLGATDETHIIRTLEYWDIERKRFPNNEHCAVIVAEDITSRFLNVISLFNSSIPLIAIKMQAIKVGGNVSLIFTTVLDEIERGTEEDDAPSVVTNRQYWETKASDKSLKLADDLLKLIQKVDAKIGMTYLKNYLGLQIDGPGLEMLAYKNGFYRLRVEREDLEKSALLLTELARKAYDRRFSE